METLGSVFSDLLRRIASDEETALIFLNELWPQIVGKELAFRSCPVALRDKRLRIAVPSKTWKKELMELHPMMIDAVNKYWHCDLVHTVKFEVRPMDEKVSASFHKYDDVC
ncbi:MAG: DUF721 domain-containing protein [Acidobacteria bacterium]|nr:DUF721 domain-containing protein [Acidobacteriota bacterium]